MKIAIHLFCVIVLSQIILAAGPQGVHEPGTAIKNNEIRETQQKYIGVPAQKEIQTENILRAGNYLLETGDPISIDLVEQGETNRIRLRVRNVSAHINGTILQEQVQNRTRLMMRLSDGGLFYIKIMPDRASEIAIQRLRLRFCSVENNCQLELKEVADKGNVRAVYEVRAQKEAKIFGVFKKRMQLKAEINAENGEIIRTRTPWWAFLTND
ncbi:MAG: hypothetical protein QXG86_00220 [Candidatus Woesearchaeota archaeon]